MMNNFTKEELMDIKRAVLWVDVNHDALLTDKIQNMIDNYCEHELENTCCGCLSIWCSKCDMEFK